MDKKTADKIRKIIAQKKASGEMLVDKALVEPKDEIEFIKKKLCEPFIDYFNAHRKKISITVMAKHCGVTVEQLEFILAYHIQKFSVDELLKALAQLAKVDANANKVLHRIALAS
jgi:hypothetical protein